MLTARALPKTRNIPDVSLMKGGSVTSSSSYSSDEEHAGDLICIEGTDKDNSNECKSGRKTTDFQDRLDALLNIVNKAKSSTSVPRFVRKVKDNTPKKSPNDVIWNAYATTNSFKAIIDGVVKIQAMVRRWLVLKETRRALELKVLAITKIQSVWRMFQCRFARKVVVEAVEKRKMEASMASAIAAAWRGFRWLRVYKSIIKDVVVVQAATRRYIARRRVNVMKTAMATKISSAWRRFYNWAAYRRIVHSSITCQALARRFLDSKIHKKLKHERCMTAATRIESATRGFVARKYFMILKSGTILVQSLSRRRVASRCLNELKEQQRMLEEEKATKIVAIWKGFRVRSGYIVIVLAARRHVRRSAAATIIQSSCRAAAGKRSFGNVRTSIILIQCMLRMYLATSRVKKMRSKLEKASNYHSKDWYVYSKSRLAGTIKIQAIYRMHIHHTKFLAYMNKMAWQKKQISYLNRYVTRMNQISGNINTSIVAECTDSDIEITEMKDADVKTKNAVMNELVTSDKANAKEALEQNENMPNIKMAQDTSSIEVDLEQHKTLYAPLIPLLKVKNVEAPDDDGVIIADLASQVMDCSCWFQPQPQPQQQIHEGDVV